MKRANANFSTIVSVILVLMVVVFAVIFLMSTGERTKGSGDAVIDKTTQNAQNCIDDPRGCTVLGGRSEASNSIGNN